MSTERVVRRLIAGFVAIVATGTLVAAQAAIKIAPRDNLTIVVWNGGDKETAYSGQFLVDVDGTFEYPTLGRVKAAGLTAREVETEVRARLEKYLVSPQVTIEVQPTMTKKFIISGEVKAPATYTFSGEMRLFEALTKAQSITDEAAFEAVISRTTPDGDEDRLNINLYDLLNGKSMANNVVLRDGDMIVVPKADPVLVTGFVAQPGPIRARRDTTVFQAITMAGGLNQRGSFRGVKIQRTVNGKKVNVPVKDVQADLVKAGDTVIVPARIF